MHLNQDFWDFANKNINEDPSKLLLKYHSRRDADFDISFAILQIECRRKFGKKLAETLSAYPDWVFPDLLSGEQSTSDRLASFHASLIDLGENITDLTAGLGIDCIHISQKAKSVTAFEIDSRKAKCLEYNVRTATISKIDVRNQDCVKALEDGQIGHCDTMFIDPARRASDGTRIYAISQCQPDVISMLPSLRKIATRLIVKLSPMLDITQVIRELTDCERIIVIGTETECKEIVALANLKTRVTSEPSIEAVTLRNDGSESIMNFTISEEQNAPLEISPKPNIGGYLYEPYPSVMKAGAFRLLGNRYGVRQLHVNTHLYYSEDYISDFPGDAMIIDNIIPYESKYLKRLKSEYHRINVATRNFDISADKLRQKLGVKDGGDKRLIAVTLYDSDKTMLITHPIVNQLGNCRAKSEKNS